VLLLTVDHETHTSQEGLCFTISFPFHEEINTILNRTKNLKHFIFHPVSYISFETRSTCFTFYCCVFKTPFFDAVNPPLCSSTSFTFFIELGNLYVQGGSDISGTLSKLHRRSKKSYFLLIISHKTVSALFRSGNENNQTLSSKY
jgi:hypothetical protein